MLTINISSLKNQLSSVLKEVQKGTEVLVVDRSHPIAKLTAVRSHEASLSPDFLQMLANQGSVTLATKKKSSKKALQARLVKAKGASPVKALLAERAEEER